MASPEQKPETTKRRYTRRQPKLRQSEPDSASAPNQPEPPILLPGSGENNPEPEKEAAPRSRTRRTRKKTPPTNAGSSETSVESVDSKADAPSSRVVRSTPVPEEPSPKATESATPPEGESASPAKSRAKSRSRGRTRKPASTPDQSVKMAEPVVREDSSSRELSPVPEEPPIRQAEPVSTPTSEALPPVVVSPPPPNRPRSRQRKPAQPRPAVPQEPSAEPVAEVPSTKRGPEPETAPVREMPNYVQATIFPVVEEKPAGLEQEVHSSQPAEPVAQPVNGNVAPHGPRPGYRSRRRRKPRSARPVAPQGTSPGSVQENKEPVASPPGPVSEGSVAQAQGIAPRPVGPEQKSGENHLSPPNQVPNAGRPGHRSRRKRRRSSSSRPPVSPEVQSGMKDAPQENHWHAREDQKPGPQPLRQPSVPSQERPELHAHLVSSVPKTALLEDIEPEKDERKSVHRMFFANEAGYNIAVITEDHHLTDFWIEEDQTYDKGINGNIYRGVITRVVPALNAAFVDIGLGKDGFLSFADLSPELHRSSSMGGRAQSKHEPLKTGDSLLVQMAKEAIADKGPSLTAKISLPGRFLVYMPYADAIRMSRMLSDREKKGFRELVETELKLKGGLIFRTASKGKSMEEIQTDLEYLTTLWDQIVQDFNEGTAPKLIHKEIALFERVLRDHYNSEIEEIIIDHPRLKHRIASFLRVIVPHSQPDELIRFHVDSERSIWSRYNLVRDIDQLFTNRIRLNCGGFIIIEEMETLTAIDVNTGKNVAGKNQEDTIVETNIEAALEISRQLRLRQIGGIIIIDFIDMRFKRNRDRVFKALERELSKDRTPSDIQQFTDLGLIQVTRQRSGKSLTLRLTYTCPHCNGSGRRPSLVLS